MMRGIMPADAAIFPGFCSVTFRKLAPAQIVALAQETGLASIEWGGDIHVPSGDGARAVEVRRMTLDAGLAIGPYGSYYRAGESEEAALPFAAVLDSASALGAPIIRVWAGKCDRADADDAYVERVVTDLRRISQLASERNILVAPEFHDGTLTNRLESTLEILRRVDHPNLRAHWQPRHGQPVETGLAEIAGLAPWLYHVHVFHWTREGDDLRRHPLAEGRERWTRFFRGILAVPGARFALLEFAPDDDPEIFRKDAQVLREILAETARAA
jgi:sugar phosphate isomerase/epimerase